MEQYIKRVHFWCDKNKKTSLDWIKSKSQAETMLISVCMGRFAFSFILNIIYKFYIIAAHIITHPACRSFVHFPSSL